MDMIDANDFWDIMDTNELTRDEIVLLTSYIVAYWRSHGTKILADTFVAQAKIEVVKELDYGTELKYHDVFMKRGTGMDYWTFYCHEKLMLERKKVETVKLEMERLTLDTSQGTETNPVALNDDEDNAMFPLAKIDTLCKLSRYTAEYSARNFIACHVATHFVENGDNPMLDPEKANKVKRTVEILKNRDMPRGVFGMRDN